MAPKMERTATPGIYKRGGRYVVTYRAGGKQRKEFAHTMAEARKLKAARTADVARGEFHPASRETFRQYAEEWVERYQGRSRGFRESTRDNYRDALKRYAFHYFGERKRVAQITPRDVANFIAWLCDESAQAKHHNELRKQRKPCTSKRLSDSSVRNIVNPVRACLRSAVQEGLIRHSPAREVALPNRHVVEDNLEGELVEDAQAFTREQLDAFLRIVNGKHRLMFRFLAVTGLRVSELIALQWRHLHLDGSSPHVKVRRQLYRGRLQPPKSRHGRRNVPLDPAVVFELRERRGEADELVFPNEVGKPSHVENLRRRHLNPVAQEVGAPWASFHTFRHTCASMLFERGYNAVQVQRWLGHHSPAFTIATYVHLLSDDLGEPLSLERELRSVGNKWATEGTETDRDVHAELAA